jgi:hypothetical protein
LKRGGGGKVGKYREMRIDQRTGAYWTVRI